VGSFGGDRAGAAKEKSSSGLSSIFRQITRRKNRESNARRIESQVPETTLLTKILYFTQKYPSKYDSLRSLRVEQENCYIFGLEWDIRGNGYASPSTDIFTGTLVSNVLDDSNQNSRIRVCAKLVTVDYNSGTTRDDLLRVSLRPGDWSPSWFTDDVKISSLSSACSLPGAHLTTTTSSANMQKRGM